MIKVYNLNLKINEESLASEPTDEKNLNPNNLAIIKNIKQEYQIVNRLEKNNTNTEDPFNEIKKEIIKLCCENGYYSMKKFLKLYIDKNFLYLFDQKDVDLFKLYNKVFVPYSIISKKIQKIVIIYLLLQK